MNIDKIEEDEIDLHGFFSTIKNGIGGIIFITLFSLSVAILYIYFSKSIYHSSVTIALDNGGESNLKNILQEETFLDVKNEDRLQLAKVTLQSRKFIRTIIDRVHVDKELFIKSNFRKNEVSEFSDIKIDIDYKDATLYGKFFEIIPLNKNKFLLKIDNDKMDYSEIHEYNKKIDNKLFSLRVIKTDGEDSFHDSIESKIINFFNNDTLSLFIKPRYYFRFFNRKFQVNSIIDNMSVNDLSDNILQISYVDNMPNQAQKVVDEIAKSYIEYTLSNKTSELEQTLEFLDKQIIDIKSNLKSRGDELQKYQQKSGLAVMSVGEDILKTLDAKSELIEKISLQIQEITKFRVNLEGGILSTVSLITAGIDTTSIQPLMDSYMSNGEEIEGLRFQQDNIEKSVTSNQRIASLIDELKDKEILIQDLLINFTHEHPQVIEAQSEFDNLRNKIHATVIANIEKLQKSRTLAKSNILNNINTVENNLKVRLRLLKSSIREKKSLLQSIPEKHIVNDNLKRRFALSENIYTFLLQKKIEVEISKASIIANTKIIEDAYILDNAVEPKKELIMLVSLIFGFVFGIIFTFIRSFFDTTIRDYIDIEKLTTAPIYGTLPFKNSERIFQEALRSIRTNLQFVIPENKRCVNILISSTVSGEGKTTTTYGLSDVISQADKRVLVIDLDLRKPRLYKEFKRSNKVGISNYLTNDTLKLEDIVHSINENLDFFPAGSIPPNPSELLMNKRFEVIVKDLEKRYDYIIFDSAPIGSVIDANMILKYVDIFLLVLKANTSKKNYIENFNKMVREKNLKSFGIILNGVKIFKGQGYGSYGYGYGYGYGINT